MSLNLCYEKLKEAQVKFSDAQRKKIETEADRLENIYRNNGDTSPDIRAKAESAAVEKLIGDIRTRQKKAVITARKLSEGLVDLKGGNGDAALNFRSMLVDTNREINKLSVESLSAGNLAAASKELGSFVEAFRSKVPSGIDTFFRANKNAIGDVVRALSGDLNVSDIGKGFARAYEKAREVLLKKLEANGVDVARLSDFGISHKWNGAEVSKMSDKEFAALIMPRLDRVKTVNAAGEMMDDAEMLKHLSEIRYEISANIGSTRGGARLGGTANANAEMHRMLHFKTGEAYLEVHEAIGSGNLFDNMMEKLQELSMDAAISEKFGATPDSVVEALAAQAKRLDVGKGGATKRTADFFSNPQVIYNYMAGNNKGGSPKVAAALSTARNFIGAAKLGSAAIMTVGDQAFIKQASKNWGMSYTNILSPILKDMITTSAHGAERRLLAARLGISLDWGFGIGAAADRFGDTSVLSKAGAVGAALQDLTLRTSGLTKMTRAAKQSFGFALNGHLASHSKLSWSKLPKKMKDGFKVNAIHEVEWEAMRKATTKIDGVEWIDPSKMSQDIEIRYMAMLDNETGKAILEPGAEARALITGGAAPGSARFELGSAFGQFKGFGITAAFSTLRQLLFNPATVGTMSKAQYSASLLVYGSMAGALALQLKSLKDGKDLRDPTDPSFIWESMHMSGTFGMGFVLGDEVPEGSGGEIARYYALASPTVRLAMGSAALVYDTVGELVKEDGAPLKPAGKFITNNLPVDAWQTDLIKQRYIFDALKQITDPKAKRSFKKQARRLEESTGQKYWWKAGKKSPSRTPTTTKKDD